MSYKVDPQYAKLRDQALVMKASNAIPGMPHGVVVDIGYPEAVITVAAMGNRRVAAMFSNGGGSVGVDELTAQAGHELGIKAAQFAGALKPTRDTPLPREGEVRFYVLIGDQILQGSGDLSELGEDKSPLSPLFHAAFRVLADMEAYRIVAAHDQAKS